jgi:hypothetical protein
MAMLFKLWLGDDPPPQPLRITLATNAKLKAQYLIILSSCYYLFLVAGPNVKIVSLSSSSPSVAVPVVVR